MSNQALDHNFFGRTSTAHIASSGLCPLTDALVFAISCKLKFGNWAFLPFADLAARLFARILKAALGLRAETDKCVVAASPAPENPEMLNVETVGNVKM